MTILARCSLIALPLALSACDPAPPPSNNSATIYVCDDADTNCEPFDLKYPDGTKK